MKVLASLVYKGRGTYTSNHRGLHQLHVCVYPEALIITDRPHKPESVMVSERGR